MNYSLIFMPFITLITAQITVLDLARLRFHGKKLFLILFIELVFQMLISLPILIFAGMSWYTNSYLITMVIPAAFTFWYTSERRNLCDLFTILVTIFLSFSVSIPAMWISDLMDNSDMWYNLIRIFLYSIVFVILHFLVRNHYLQTQDEIEKGWGVFCIVPFTGSAILYYKYWQYRMSGDFLRILVDCIIIATLMATVFIVFLYVFAQLHEKFIMQEEKRILAMQNKAQREQFERQKEEAEKTNRRWHDLRHNLQELIDLLEAGDKDAALTYLKEQRGVDSIHREDYCMHLAVNSILCLWAERSRKAGIDVQIKTDIPDKLEIEPMELSALIANAFENAYEACQRLTNDKKKFIRVESHYNGKRLAIGFINTCIQEIPFVNDLPVSSKAGGGIGTRSIAYTVRRFHGAAYYEAHNGIFQSRFILNIPPLEIE